MLSPEIAAKATALVDTDDATLKGFAPLDQAFILALRQYMKLSATTGAK